MASIDDIFKVRLRKLVPKLVKHLLTESQKPVVVQGNGKRKLEQPNHDPSASTSQHRLLRLKLLTITGQTHSTKQLS